MGMKGMGWVCFNVLIFRKIKSSTSRDGKLADSDLFMELWVPSIMYLVFLLFLSVLFVSL